MEVILSVNSGAHPQRRNAGHAGPRVCTHRNTGRRHGIRGLLPGCSNGSQCSPTNNPISGQRLS